MTDFTDKRFKQLAGLLKEGSLDDFMPGTKKKLKKMPKKSMEVNAKEMPRYAGQTEIDFRIRQAAKALHKKIDSKTLKVLTLVADFLYDNWEGDAADLARYLTNRSGTLLPDLKKLGFEDVVEELQRLANS